MFVLFPEPYDPRIQSRWKAVHPFRDFPGPEYGLFTFTPELPEHHDHVNEKIGLGPTGSLMNRQPDQTERIADRNFTTQIQIGIFNPRMIDIVQDPDDGVIAPFQSFKQLDPRMAGLIIPECILPVPEGLFDPLLDSDHDLGFILRISEYPGKFRILVQQLIKQLP